MSKRINSFWRLVLGSLIAMLGFGSCKTAKKAQPAEEGVVLYGPPPTKIERAYPSQEIRLLYGAPPVRLEKKSE